MGKTPDYGRRNGLAVGVERRAGRLLERHQPATARRWGLHETDKVMNKQLGGAKGTAKLLDVVGIDTSHHAQQVMAEGFPSRMSKDYRDAIDVLFEARRYGQKNQQGFYRWESDKKGKLQKVSDPATDELLAPVCKPRRTFSDEEIIARMMLPLLNEVVRCLEEQIIASPAEADMALVYGLGFPPFHGGAFRYLDTLGNATFIAQAKQFARLGPLYQLPEVLTENAAQRNESWYPPAEPINDAALTTA